VLLPSQISERQKNVLYPSVIVLYIIMGDVSYCERLTKSLILKKVMGFGVERMMERVGCEFEHSNVRYRGSA